MFFSKKEHISSINEYIPSDSAFVCFSSFESRCYTIAKSIDVKKIRMAYAFRNTDPPMSQYNESNIKKICEAITHTSIVEVSLNSPVTVADKIFSTIWDIINASITNIIIDISTFTHESLLMLLKTLYIYRSSFNSILLVYNGAAEYSSWLSKGCKEIRNVIGYPGSFTPSYKDYMIILTGFEKERATMLVELFEPDVLSIGNGSEPTDRNHLGTMHEMKDEFDAWFNNLGATWESFDFSCSNIESTAEKIVLEINKRENENIVLVPLNTKLSTISAAIVALKNEKIQVVYPVPEIYNPTYSIPSDNFTIVNLKDALELY